MNGLTTVNIELTSRCQKKCFCCGRRKLERDYPELCNWGDMNPELVLDILTQIPKGIVIQYHSNGEPLLYTYLDFVLEWSYKNIRCLSTNAIALLEKADDIIGRLETLTISVVEEDECGDKQYEDVKKFLEIKGDRKPYMIYRLLGNIKIVPGTDGAIINEEREKRWYRLPGLICTRVLHNPMGSYEYTKKVTRPEIGICLDLLNHLVIDRYGNVYPCVRFDPLKINKLGNIKENTLEELWNGEKRQFLIKEHTKGNRNCSELCSKCDFYGCPTGS